MMFTYFFDSRFPHPDHEHCLMALRRFTLNSEYSFESLDVSVWGVSRWREMIERFGVISLPIVCFQDKILCYDPLKTASEISTLLQALSSLPCPNDSLLLYS